MLLTKQQEKSKKTLEKIIHNSSINACVICVLMIIGGYANMADANPDIIAIGTTANLTANIQVKKIKGTSIDSAERSHDLYQSMLAGGALQTCSSLSRPRCKQDSFSDYDKLETLYELNSTSLKRLEKFIQKTQENKDQITLKTLVPKLRKLVQKEPFTRNKLFDELAEINVLSEVDALSDSSYFALLDHLELAQIAPNGKRKQEVANVLASKSASSIAVYQAFVEQVKMRAKIASQEAHILVITASSRDAFEVVDFYTSVFSSLGVKATWLPIDASLSSALSDTAIHASACENLNEYRAAHHLYDRERIYPNLTQYQKQTCEQPNRLIELIDQAQGVFINGGDQSKTLAAITHISANRERTFTPYWQKVIDKVADFEMIVGGTSAGAAVQAGISYAGLPIPMISNGTSSQAVKRGAFAASAPSQRCTTVPCAQAISANDLTYMPTGGAGTFSLGTVDTHFSERNREGRLAMLSLSQSTRLSVGVDETTALLFQRQGEIVKLQVVGENGVFFVDGNNTMQRHNVIQNKHGRQLAGFSHYLPSGISATINLGDNTWALSDGMQLLKQRKNLDLAKKGIWRNSTRKYCGTTEPIEWEIEDVHYRLSPDENTRFFTQQNKHCGYLFLPFLIGHN